MIKADGASLDERFADGWNTTDVAATDPGVAEGAAAGVHALIGGRIVALDGPAFRPGARRLRPGHRPGLGRAVPQRSSGRLGGGATARAPPTWPRQLWIGDLGGEAAEAADGHTLSRPTWSLDDAVWVVADGNTVLRAIQETASGQPARLPVDSAGVSSRFPGVIAELQLSRDGTRAAMIDQRAGDLRERRADPWPVSSR